MIECEVDAGAMLRGVAGEFRLTEKGLSLGNQLAQKKLAQECADWIERKVEIQSVTRTGFLHGKMYHVQDGKVAHAVLGSSNFTVPGLGLLPVGNNIELNLVVTDDRDRDDLLVWFNELWNDNSLVEDVKPKVLAELARLYGNKSPQFIYYLTLFHLFRDFLDGTRDLDESLRQTALPDTGIWRALFSFQKDGAKAAINKILGWNGCILADSVGLGKTDTAFTHTLGIATVRETTRMAQTHFTNWARLPPAQRKTRDLLAALGGDFFKLLDGLSIARSRRQIAEYYKTEMKRLGGFPHRPPPLALHPPIDLHQGFLLFEQLDKEISALELALHHPTSKLRDDLPEAVRAPYLDKIHGSFTQEGREGILIKMMRVNFLKRLESSVDSFRLTLGRTLGKINELEKRITAFEEHRDTNPEVDYDSLTPAEFEDPDFEGEDFTIGGKRRIPLGHLKLPEWLQAVRHDRAQLQFLLKKKTEEVKPARDGKLARLREIIEKKATEPSVNLDGESNRKVLVFTAFADTAKYLHRELLPWARKLGRHVALVVGDGSNATTLGTTGLNEAFVVDGATRSALLAADKTSTAALKRYARGRDVARWLVELGDEWLIFTRGNFDIKKHPAIRKHLEQFRPQLTPGIVGGRKPGSYEWFEIQDNIAYWQQFERPKIVSTKVSIRPTFALDCTGSYLANTAYFFPVDSGAHYLLALLNSNVSFAYSKRVFVEKQGGWYEVQPQGLEAFPVPNATTKETEIVERTAFCVQWLHQNSRADSTANPRDPLMLAYFEQILNGLVYELYFPDEVHGAGLRLFDIVEQVFLPALPAETQTGMSVLRALFETLHDGTHPLRIALQKLQTLDPIRIIEGRA